MSCNCMRNEFKMQTATETVDNGSILFSTSPDLSTFDPTNANWSELTINGCVTVPEAKPDIEAIDSVYSQIEIVRTKVVVAPSVGTTHTPVTSLEGKITTGRKLIIEGLICSTISYVANEPTQSMHTFHGKTPFSAYIILPLNWATDPSGNPIDSLDVTFNAIGIIENTMVKSICERQVCLCSTFILQPVSYASPTCSNQLCDTSGLKCSLHPTSTVEHCCDDQPIIQGVSSDAQINAILTSTTDNLFTELFVPEILNIPACKPDLQKIISVTSKFEILCQKVVVTPTGTTTSDPTATNYEGLKTTGRKLIIEGVLKQRITYISETDCKSVHSAHFNMPVSTFIILPYDAELTDKYRLTSCIEDIFVCNLNERQIFKNTTLFIKANELTCK